MISNILRNIKSIKVSYLFVILFLLTIIPINILLTEKAAYTSCCEVDKPGDAPSTSSTEPGLMSTAKVPPNVKVFKTDSHPELDFYQPCSGGDNLIIFPINVSGIEIAAIKSASLTLAVWDVDFDCGGACSGRCERDTVYFNNNQLTTPVAYLTGANNQWSTVTFNVNPAWVVEGNNTIKIDIDILSRSCWCVTCDWGELRLTLENPPEIEEIIITPDDYPLTSNDVKFEAKIKESPGYEIVSVDWSITDVESGKVDFLKVNENPFTQKPAAGHHKKKEATCTVSYKNTATGKTGIVQEKKAFNIFFEKDKLVDPTKATSNPNWFEYWMKDKAVPDMAGFKYDATGGGYGARVGTNLYLRKKASGQHYNPAIIIPKTYHGKESFGGPTVTGIDCAAEVVAHERYHLWVIKQWETGGQFEGKTDSDKGVPDVACNDRLPDFYENDTSHTKINDTDTYDLETIKNTTYRTYGDNEYMAMRAGNGAYGVKDNDWSHPGKQTADKAVKKTTTTASTSLSSIVLASVSPPQEAVLETGFTDSYSDYGNDTNGNSFYDYLTVTVGLSIAKSDNYDLVGWLKNSDGDIIAIVNEEHNFMVGTYFVDLNFDGLMIHYSKSNGPYTLSAILSDEEGNEIDFRYEVYDTSSYSYTEFEGQQSSFTGNYSDYGVDTDNDGIYDYLTVEVQINTAIEGDYTIEGFLYDNQENAIVFTNVSTSLSIGTQTVKLDFDGLPIALNKKDGPYVLSYLSIYDSTNMQIDFIKDAYNTGPYSYTSFQTPTAAFNETFSDYGVDTDSDGYYNSLAIDVGIDVIESGNYILTGLLYDKNNEEIVSATSESYLNTGSQSIKLEFDGYTIHAHGVSGQFHLKHLKLYGENGSLVCLTGDAYITSAYDYNTFERPLIIFTGNFSDYGTDLNGDGVYEYLTVDIEVNVVNAGNYAMNARLMDKNNDEMVWASTASWVPANQAYTMQLNFDATEIYAHSVKGPYYVRDLYVYNIADISQSAYVYDAYTTTSAWLIGNLPPIADAGSDQIVECACNTLNGTVVVLDGSSSSDPDGDPLTYIWTGPFLNSPAHEPTPTVTLLDGCPGNFVITLVVNDGTVDSAPDEVEITVNDTTPPEISLTVSPDTLWPPNHKMVQIVPSWEVYDACDETPIVSLKTIEMNESDETNTYDPEFDNTQGDGHTIDDIQVDENGDIYLRAERSGTGSGRIYTFTYTATDSSGNSSTASATVTVPHDQQ